MSVSARLLAFLCSPPTAFFSHFPLPPCALMHWPSFFWCQWVQLWPLYPVRLICCPSNHPHFSLSSCSCLPEHSLLSHSHYLTPCSLSHLCIVLSAFLHSPWVPALPYTIIFFFLLLLPSVFLSALSPFFHTAPIPAHMETHTDHSIDYTVNKSEALAGTCHQQHHPACLHQTNPYLLLQYTRAWENLAKRIYIPLSATLEILFGKFKNA